MDVQETAIQIYDARGRQLQQLEETSATFHVSEITETHDITRDFSTTQWKHIDPIDLTTPHQKSWYDRLSEQSLTEMPPSRCYGYC